MLRLLLLLSVLFVPSLLHASALPMIDGRYLREAFGQVVNIAAMPIGQAGVFNATLQNFGGYGMATQTSGITMADGALHGFSGTLYTFAGYGNVAIDYRSVFDVTFLLDRPYAYSTFIDITNQSMLSPNSAYSFSLTGAFSRSGNLMPYMNTLNFVQSGILSAGEYRFQLWLDTFHAETPGVYASSLDSTFGFNLAPVSMPDTSSLGLIAGCFAICLYRSASQRTEQRHIP